MMTVSENALQPAQDLLLSAQRSGGDVVTAGNGGSATTASHFAVDLLILARQGIAVRAWSMADRVGFLTAEANDVSYDSVYATPQLRPADLLVCFSVSGRSPNLLLAASRARQSGVPVLSFLGGTEEAPLAQLSDHAIVVPCLNPGVVETVHVGLFHELSARLASCLGSA